MATTTSSPAATPSTTLPPTTTTTTTAETDIEIESLIQQLFRGSPPDYMVFQQRSDAIQVWDAGVLTEMTGWPGDIVDAQHDLALVHTHNLDLVDLGDGTVVRPDFDCVSLHSREDLVLTLIGCGGPWEYQEARTGEPADPPIEYEELFDGEWVWFAERGGSSLHGQGDAEGNLHTIESEAGQDLIADDYASLPILSPDGTMVAYVDHADPAAESHFVSSVVVVRDTATGDEQGRWVLDEPVTCLEMTSGWLIACLGDPFDYPDGLQDQLAAVNLSTGEVTTVTTETRLFLPA